MLLHPFINTPHPVQYLAYTFLHKQGQVFLAQEAGAGAYDPIASELGMSRGAVSKAVQRMRIRYHQLVRQEVADTVTRTSEVEAELVELFQ